MSEFDIRTKEHGKVSEVRFDGPYEDDSETATRIVVCDVDSSVFITDDATEIQAFLSEEGAKHLIEALQFALDNEWWD